MHDFKLFPELTNSQMQLYYFQSPHKQITEDFRARVIKVIDGDTIRVTTNFRDFNFPIRFFDLAAPELKEKGGKESKSWLESQILGKDVDIILSKQRVEKWGRLLAKIFFHGMDIGEDSIRNGKAVSWKNRKQSSIPDFKSELETIKI